MKKKKNDIKEKETIISFFETIENYSEEHKEEIYELLQDAFLDQTDNITDPEKEYLKNLMQSLETLRTSNEELWLNLIKILFGDDISFVIEEFYVRISNE